MPHSDLSPAFPSRVARNAQALRSISGAEALGKRLSGAQLAVAFYRPLMARRSPHRRSSAHPASLADLRDTVIDLERAFATHAEPVVRRAFDDYRALLPRFVADLEEEHDCLLARAAALLMVQAAAQRCAPAEPAMVQPAMVQPAMAEPAMVGPAMVEPAMVGPVAVSTTAVTPAAAASPAPGHCCPCVPASVEPPSEPGGCPPVPAHDQTAL